MRKIVLLLSLFLMACEKIPVNGVIVCKKYEAEYVMENPVWPNGMPFRDFTLDDEDFIISVKQFDTGDTIDVRLSEEEWDTLRTGDTYTNNTK